MSGTCDATIERSVIPDALVERKQWVCWREEDRDGKPTKVPVVPTSGAFASTTDPDTWTGFETALEFLATGEADGVGFVFSEDDPIVGVDLDDCREPETETVDSTAQDIIERLDSYTEVSPSGTGFHVLVAGTLPDGRNRRGSVELYDSARFFTVTGDHVDGTSARVARRQDALDAIHRDYVQNDETDDSDTGNPPAGGGAAHADSGTDAVDLEDTEVLENARTAENGEKFDQLWTGSTAGYDSHSEADMALCCLLAFWTGGDRAQIDRLFRQSELMREKWDEVHYADGSTYGEKTVERAVTTVTEYYDPDAATSSDSGDVLCDGLPDRRDGEDSRRSPAYLMERNRLLAERVAELETTLEEKNQRIDRLESRLRRRAGE